MRIVLATPPEKFWAKAMVRLGAQSLLMSYWYFRGQTMKNCREILQTLKQNNIWLMIDSGAFTFFQEYPWLRPTATREDFEDPEGPYQIRLAAGKPVSREHLIEESAEYVEKYIHWVKTFYLEGLIHSWAEVDIGRLIGMKYVYKWREDWKDAGVAGGLITTVHLSRPLYVKGELHQAMDQEDIARMMTGEFGYIGFGHIRDKASKIAHHWILNHYKTIMRERNIRLHGWAKTKHKDFEYFPWYSVDSSTWSSYGRWGIVFKYDPATTRVLRSNSLQMFGNTRADRDKSRKLWMQRSGLYKHAEMLGILDGIKELNTKDMDILNAYQWILLQRAYLEDTRLAYWLGAEEKRKIDKERRKRANVSDSARKTVFFRRNI